MLQQLKDDVEIVVTICACDIEKNKVRGDLGIPYEEDVLRLIDIFRGMELYVGSVVVTQYNGQSAADAFYQERQAAQAAPAVTVNQTVEFNQPIETPAQVARRMEEVNEALAMML